MRQHREALANAIHRRAHRNGGHQNSRDSGRYLDPGLTQHQLGRADGAQRKRRGIADRPNNRS